MRSGLSNAVTMSYYQGIETEYVDRLSNLRNHLSSTSILRLTRLRRLKLLQQDCVHDNVNGSASINNTLYTAERHDGYVWDWGPTTTVWTRAAGHVRTGESSQWVRSRSWCRTVALCGWCTPWRCLRACSLVRASPATSALAGPSAFATQSMADEQVSMGLLIAGESDHGRT